MSVLSKPRVAALALASVWFVCAYALTSLLFAGALDALPFHRVAGLRASAAWAVTLVLFVGGFVLAGREKGEETSPWLIPVIFLPGLALEAVRVSSCPESSSCPREGPRAGCSGR